MIQSSIKKPFDPSTLKAEVKNATIGQLVEMLRNDLIDLNPDFQRKAHLWPANRKSQLIESILLGLPLPSFYFYVDEGKKKWVVIDGLQRLCSLQSFMVDKDLKLQGLEFLETEKYGKYYEDFDYFDKLAMSMHPVTLNVLTGNTSAEARYIIFQRVNSKGTPLNATEIRNALYQGIATKMIERMVALPKFERLVSGQISLRRMKDREYVSRFLTFYLKDYADYDGKMNLYISNAMDEMNKQLSEEDGEEIIWRFERTLQTCEQLFGLNAFRKPGVPKKGTRRNPISLAVFEMLTVSIAHLSEPEQDNLVKCRKRFIRYYNEMFGDTVLQNSLREGTGRARAIAYRLGKMENVIRKTLEMN